jgi:hypothetical protein
MARRALKAAGKAFLSDVEIPRFTLALDADIAI